jgi:tetratricopeptide (TPR) repeat protein
MLSEAETELETAVRLDPQMPEAAVSLGLALGRRGERVRAIALFRNALAQRPGFTAARFNLALALFRGGETGEARPHFEALVQSDPDDRESRLYLGQILIAQQEYDAAAAHLKKAAESAQPGLRAAAREALRRAAELQRAGGYRSK